MSREDPLFWKCSPAQAREYVDLGLWPNEPLSRKLAAWARSAPEREALVDRGGRTTFGALAREVAAAVVGLRKLGVTTGQRVALQLPNRREFYVVHFALEALGAVSVPLPPIYRAHELAFILELTEATLIAVPRSLRGFDHVAMIADLRGRLKDLRAIVVENEGAALDEWCTTFEDLTAAPGGDELLTGGDPASLVEIAFTSGSTGEPKGVMHTANSIAADVLTIASTCRLGAEDVILMPSTLGHQLGFALGVRLPMLLGAKVILMDAWDPNAALENIAKEGVTFICTTPTFLVDLLAAPALDAAKIQSFRSWVLAGAVVGHSLLERARERIPHVAIAQVFGMTEVGAVVVNPPDTPREKAHMTGSIPRGVQLHVLGAAGEQLPRGADGELVIRCPGLFSGYYARPELTQSSFTADGFFRSGDQVRIDEDGFVQVTGRFKELIKRGGESIAPAELEEILIRHPKITAVGIVGYADERLGERVCACIVPVEGATLTLDELVTWVKNAGVAKQKWPERLEIVDAFPMTSIGKIHKAALRRTVADRIAGAALEERLLTHWFGRIGGPTTLAELKDRTKTWFFRNDAFDADLRERFGADAERAANGELQHLAATPRGRLVLVLLLDQLPRNIHRGTPRSFATDGAALAIVVEGLERAADRELTPPERLMFYMPLMHSEDRAVLRRCVERYRSLLEEGGPELAEELAGALRFAERHCEIVERFGRYPHRNKVLGRDSTAEEIAFLQEPNSSF